MAITFQAERLIGRLNALEGTQIKYAGTQAMKRLGYEMRSELGQYMQATFNNAVPFTVNSALYRTTGGLSVGIFINPTGDEKGQSPASYLFPLTPQSDGGAALTTRFTKGLRKIGVINNNTWALNWLPDPETPQRNGTTEPGLLKALLSALSRPGGRLATKRAKYAAGGVRYFSVPDLRSSRQNTYLADGIYRVKTGEQPIRLMGYLQSQPYVPQKFQFERTVRERSAALLPGLLRAELDRAMR